MSTFRRGIDVLEIKGPYKPTGISFSTTRPLIFICDPKAGRRDRVAPSRSRRTWAHRAIAGR